MYIILAVEDECARLSICACEKKEYVCVCVCAHIPVQSRVGVSLQSLPTLVVMLYNSVAFSPRGVYAHSLSLSLWFTLLYLPACLPACPVSRLCVYVCMSVCVYV